MSGEQYRRRVLVVRLSALGDVAILEPVLRQRAAANPDVLFLVAAPPRLEPLFGGMANVHYLPTDKRQRPRQLYRQLAASNPHIVADMHHVLRTIVVDWLFRLHGVKVRSLYKQRLSFRTFRQPIWQRYDRVFERCGLSGRVKEDGYWEVKPASDSRRVVGVAPFAQHQGKIWPLEKMERLVATLSQKGCQVCLFGSADEAELLDAWAQRYKGVKSLAGRYGFAEEMQQIASLDVMVSMDSANMHFASSLGVPVVSIWGATHPCRGFYGWRQDPSWAVQHEMKCRPCSKYGNKPCRRGDYPCLQSIEPSEVLERIDKMLGL